MVSCLFVGLIYTILLFMSLCKKNETESSSSDSFSFVRTRHPPKTKQLKKTVGSVPTVPGLL